MSVRLLYEPMSISYALFPEVVAFVFPEVVAFVFPARLHRVALLV